MGEMQEVTSRVGASECFQGRVWKEMAMECAEVDILPHGLHVLRLVMLVV